MILISFAEPDRPIADRIAAACRRLDRPFRLDPRDDWMSQALRGFGDSTHGIVVVSSRNATSWWLPFWIGRARERGLPFVAYRAEPLAAELAFLPRARVVTRMDALTEAWGQVFNVQSAARKP